LEYHPPNVTGLTELFTASGHYEPARPFFMLNRSRGSSPDEACRRSSLKAPRPEGALYHRPIQLGEVPDAEGGGHRRAVSDAMPAACDAASLVGLVPAPLAKRKRSAHMFFWYDLLH